MDTDPSEILDLNEEIPDPDPGRVERSVTVMLPLVGLVLLATAILVGLLGGGVDDEPDSIGVLTSSAQTTTPPTANTTASTPTSTVPSTATVQSTTVRPAAPSTTLVDHVDLPALPFSGVVYTLSRRGRVVRIDLGTGDVRRSEERLRNVWMLRPLDDNIAIIGEPTLILDKSLQRLATLRGDFLTSGRSEIWMLEQQDSTGRVSEITRYDNAGNAMGTVASSIGWISGWYAEGKLHISNGSAIWTVNSDGTVTKSDSAPVNGLFDGTGSFTPVLSDCDITALRCSISIDVNGVAIALGDDRIWAPSTSPSGRLLLVSNAEGTRIIDSAAPGRTDLQSALPGDTWAINSDLIVRAEGDTLLLIDPVGGDTWSVVLPNDISVSSNFHPVVIIEAGQG